MSLKYSGINYEKLLELLEEFEFPYNDTLIEILYKFDNTDISEYTFYYKQGNDVKKDVVYQVLTFNKYSKNNIIKAKSNINCDIEGEFFPFVVTEDGNYVGLFVSDFGEETVQLYNVEKEEVTQICGVDNKTLTLEDFLNGM